MFHAKKQGIRSVLGQLNDHRPFLLLKQSRTPLHPLLNDTFMKNIGYQLFESPQKGEGIYATKRFFKNDIVMLGAIQEQDIDKNHSHASQMGEFRHALHAGLIPKVNHSCSPNCGIQLNEEGAHNFVAMKTIEIGDEVTFDYSMRNYSIDFFPKACACGATSCRTTITGWKDLPETIKSEYEGYVAPYLLEMDTKNKNEIVELSH